MSFGNFLGISKFDIFSPAALFWVWFYWNQIINFRAKIIIFPWFFKLYIISASFTYVSKKSIDWFIFCDTVVSRNYDTYETNLYYLPATKSLSINLVFHFSVENVEILLYPGKTKLTCTPNLGRGAKLFSCQIFKVTIWHNWQNQPWSHRNFHCKSQIW